MTSVTERKVGWPKHELGEMSDYLWLWEVLGMDLSEMKLKECEIARGKIYEYRGGDARYVLGLCEDSPFVFEIKDDGVWLGFERKTNGFEKKMQLVLDWRSGSHKNELSLNFWSDVASKLMANLGEQVTYLKFGVAMGELDDGKAVVYCPNEEGVAGYSMFELEVE